MNVKSYRFEVNFQDSASGWQEITESEIRADALARGIDADDLIQRLTRDRELYTYGGGIVMALPIVELEELIAETSAAIAAGLSAGGFDANVSGRVIENGLIEFQAAGATVHVFWDLDDQHPAIFNIGEPYEIPGDRENPPETGYSYGRYEIVSVDVPKVASKIAGWAARDIAREQALPQELESIAAAAQEWRKLGRAGDDWRALESTDPI